MIICIMPFEVFINCDQMGWTNWAYTSEKNGT